MKKNLIYFSLAFAAMAMATSCSDDDPASGSGLASKTYSQETLALTYNGEPLVGKTASFNVTSSGNAEITLAGENLDLSEYLGELPALSGVPTTIQTCGALPGSASFTLPVKLSGSETECSFSGSSESEYCTFSYEGTVTGETMTLDLKDVKLKDTTMADATVSLTGSWTVPAFDYNFYNDLRVNWVSEKGIELFGPGYETPVASVVGLALMMMPVYDNMGLGDALPALLKEVTFGEDGNIRAKYVDTKSESKETVSSPANIAQYIVAGDKILIYLNPQAVIVNTLKNTRGEDLSEVVKTLLSAILPMATNGIPLNYGAAISNPDDNGKVSYFDYPETMSVYLGTETLKPLLSAIMPLLQDDNMKKAIIEMATLTPGYEEMGGMLEIILNALPEVVEKSSVIEIGINLKR